VVNLTEAFKFDKPEVKRRIAMVKEFVKAAGRQPDALEISGGAASSSRRRTKRPPMR